MFLYLSIALCFFAQALNSSAQSPSGDWSFPYYDKFPHARPLCSPCNNPQTKITYGSDFSTITQDAIVYHLDKNFLATFYGGAMWGGNYENESCRYGIYGYGTFKQVQDNTGNCPNSQNEIFVNFSQPVFGRQISFKGKYPQQLIITEGGQSPITIDLDPVYENGQIYDKGTKTVSLSGKKITLLTVKSLDPYYGFSITNLRVGKEGSSTPNPGGPPPNYCNVTPLPKPAPQNLSGYDWTMRSEISDADGLVLSNIRLKGRLMAERISVPYYQIKTSVIPSLRGELRPNDTSGNLRSRLVSYSVETTDDRLIVKAVYAIDNISSAQSCLSITQNYEFLKQENGSVCAPDPTGGHLSNSCSRWRAAVTYDFKSNGGETLFSLNVAQRNHFRVNDKSENSVGLSEIVTRLCLWVVCLL